MNNFLCYLSLMFINVGVTQSQPLAGALAPGAIKLEGHQLSSMSVGAAVFTKGEETALIDKSGKYVLPFGKYRIIQHLKGRYGLSLPLGFYEVESKDLPNGGIINSTGKLIYKPELGSDFTIKENVDATDRVCVIQQNSYSKQGFNTLKTLLLFYNGKTVDLGEMEVVAISDGIIQFIDLQTGKYGYADTLGKVLIKPQFYRSRRFSEGVAAASVLDDLKGFLWGFIDKTGKFVISPRFLLAPSDFSMGLAAFCNREGDGGFINHQGDTVIYLVPDTRFIFDFQRGYAKFHGGYFIHSHPIVRVDGMLYNEKQFFEEFKLDTSVVITPNCHDDQVIFLDAQGNRGMLHLKDHAVIPPIFRQLTVFDDTSNLAFAELLLSIVKGNKRYRSGLINKNGQFVLYIDDFY